MEPLVSIGIPVKNGFANKSEKDINLEKAIIMRIVRELILVRP